MKRLTSLVLALLLALTMMVGAFAETADVTGEWYGELLGIQVTLTINADGTYKMDIAGMDSEEGVWEKNEDGNLVVIPLMLLLHENMNELVEEKSNE